MKLKMDNLPVLFITGTSKGIGNYLAKHYANNGYQVIGCSRSKFDSLEMSNYRHFEVDVSIEKDVVSLFKDIAKTYKKIDIVINNAAVNSTLSMVAMTSFEKMKSTMEINYLGTFLVCREAVKLMVRNKFGRIINMSSMAVKHEVSGEAGYTASKAAVVSLSRVLAKEVYPFGITCNVIAPSALDTDLMQSIPKDALKDVLKRNAILSLGEPSDIINAIDWISKPESHSITGQVIYLGGV